MRKIQFGLLISLSLFFQIDTAYCSPIINSFQFSGHVTYAFYNYLPEPIQVGDPFSGTVFFVYDSNLASKGPDGQWVGAYYVQIGQYSTSEEAKGSLTRIDSSVDNLLLHYWSTATLNFSGSPLASYNELELNFNGTSIFDQNHYPTPQYFFPTGGGTLWFLVTNINLPEYPDFNFLSLNGSIDSINPLYYPEPSAVPVPAAAWLLGTGLIGLVALKRRLQR